MMLGAWRAMLQGEHGLRVGILSPTAGAALPLLAMR